MFLSFWGTSARQQKTKEDDINGESAGLTGRHHRGDLPTLPSNLPTSQRF
jgi:hypothetical protein